ncbi:MAG TPA: VWA domain-containing protein [Candidatus Polarisedimenticolia bacterium]|nr:VWA domain-containing protein [Candidatus Polarisedimenticolia bacterium]
MQSERSWTALFHGALAVLAIQAALWEGPAAARGEEQPPRDIGKKEHVEVRLVTLDVLVMDRSERTVPGLRAEDFTLVVDGRRVPIDTLDETCAGAMDAPRAGRAATWSEPAAADSEPRRIIFAFDYLHLPLIKSSTGIPLMAHTKAIKRISSTLREAPPGNEEIMIAVLDGGLRIEQPFSRDRAQTLDTLARMEMDVTLYAGHFDHATERPLIAGLSALVDLADTVPGSKALVLFTGGPGPDGRYDRDLRKLASHASLARVAFYPVDGSGLDTPFR